MVTLDLKLRDIPANIILRLYLSKSQWRSSLALPTSPAAAADSDQ